MCVFNYTAIGSEIEMVAIEMERFSLVFMPVHLERPTRLLMFRRMDYWIQFISQSMMSSSGRSEFLVSNVRPVVWKWEKVRLQRLWTVKLCGGRYVGCWNDVLNVNFCRIIPYLMRVINIDISSTYMLCTKAMYTSWYSSKFSTSYLGKRVVLKTSNLRWW